MASWLMRSTEKQTVWIRALAGDIVLYFSANHFTLTVPLSTQVYEWVLVNLMLGDNPTMDLHPIQGGVERWKYSWSLYAIETGMSSSWINHSAHM